VILDRLSDFVCGPRRGLLKKIHHEDEALSCEMSSSFRRSSE
jgi:hypothetical protein